MNNTQIMAVNCVRHMKIEKQKYHHNVAVATVFDSIDDHPYFIVKIPQVGAKNARRAGMLTHGI